MKTSSRQTLYIFDGTSLIYRAFYAIRLLRNSKGEPTNAVFGFAKMLQKFITEHAPTHLAMVFDAKGPTFRHEAFEDYKAHRKPMPDELVMQLPWIKDLSKAYGLSVFEISGVEADDVIGSLAKKAQENFEVLVISPDKDILQMVGPHVRVIPNPAENLILNEKGVEERHGVRASQIPDLLALIGDSSDNIPGVTGVGPKTAVLLLQEFENLEQIFETPWSQKGKIRKVALIPHEKEARLSKQLATLNLEVPLEISPEDTALKEKDIPRLTEIFKTLEFRDFLKEIAPHPEASTSTPFPTAKNKIASNFRIDAGKPIGLALRAEGDHPLKMRLIEVAIALSPQETYSLSLGDQNTLDSLRKILKDPQVLKVGYDLKRIKLILENHNLPLEGLFFDVMIASFLINPSLHHQNLTDLANYFLKSPPPILKDPSQVTVQDSLITLELMPILEAQLKDSGQENLFQKIELPLIEVLADMEKTGIPIDRAQLQKMSHDFEHSLQELEKKIHAGAGESFNIQSTKELSKILFEKLKLPVLKKTKTGYSTNAEVLTQLIDHHLIIPLLLEFRQISKLKSTYVESLPLLVHPETGRLHTTFHQTIAETGRLSSSEPNLQNIPIRSTLGKKIRSAFVAPPETLLVSADYSQIELRVLAHLSGDPGLMTAFEQDEDIHRWTAQAIFHVQESEVDDTMRSKAKTINFGILYGMSVYGLSKELGVSSEEAGHFMNQYFQRFPQVQDFLKGILEKARREGFVTTLMGRKRYLPDLTNPQMQIRQMAERMAINTPIQGTAADLMKMAMLKVHQALTASHLKSKMVLQIHDELIFIVPQNELKKIKPLIQENMENVFPLKVKLKVDIHTGKNWMEI
ncbi:MAG: DNA polymerase I [Chlamydiae bacterium]|nr:DNA polymerase I [Chlamydiota bacterium]MBI3266043.1 DNA polymerase I [Chlamydiota bacterium]